MVSFVHSMLGSSPTLDRSITKENPDANHHQCSTRPDPISKGALAMGLLVIRGGCEVPSVFRLPKGGFHATSFS